MPLRLRIDHRTRYLYERPVSLSPHLVRTFPRTEPGRLVQRLSFVTHEDADVQYRRDIFDNVFARCFYPDPVADLRFDYSVEVELHEQNPFHFLLDFDAAEFPFRYQPEIAGRLASYVSVPGSEGLPKLLPLAFWAAPPAGTNTVTMLVSLVEALHRSITYEVREEGAARPPAETIQIGRGSCRDVAVLLAAILRELGLAARLASGYLCEFGAEARARRAEGSMHLWTEVFLPGAGWTGLDGTNGIFCNENFITTAVGLTTPEVTPISGRYFSSEVVPAKMTATLELTAL